MVEEKYEVVVDQNVKGRALNKENMNHNVTQEVSLKKGDDQEEEKEKSAFDASYPNSKTLLISSKRPRTFLERTAKELFAGGVDTIILSALGDAIPIAVQLQVALEEKKAAVCNKIETTQTSYSVGNKSNRFMPGIQIFMNKHAEFKGSRISPGYVFFCEAPNIENNEIKYTPCYDSISVNNNSTKSIKQGNFIKEGFASVNAGNINLSVGGEGLNGAFKKVLEIAGISVDCFQALHQSMLTRAIEENTNVDGMKIRSVLKENPLENNLDIKLALCRIGSNTLRKVDPVGRLGSVFISVFNKKFPFNCPSNFAMVYIVSPQGKYFKNKEEFLKGVHETAANLMTALCDYNGFLRREEEKTHTRISICRVSLFSGGSHMFPNTSKLDVAKAILCGLNEAYSHGPAPRLNFAYDEDVFKKAWIEVTGINSFMDFVKNPYEKLKNTSNFVAN